MEKTLRIFYRIKCKNSNTLDQYQRFVGEFLEFLKVNYNVEEPEDIKQYMVIEYISSLDEKVQDKRYKKEKLIELSQNTKYTKLKVVSSLLTFLYENEFINKDLAKTIDLSKHKEKERHDIYMTKDEVSLLMDYMRSDIQVGNARCIAFNKARDRFMFALILKLGNRIGEVTSLTFKGLDFEEGTITIDGKNRKYKQSLVNQFDSQLQELYRGYMVDRDKRGICNELVFTTQNGKQLYRSNCNDILKKRIHEANVYANMKNDSRKIDESKGLTIHKLRHTCGSLLNSSNQSLETIASVLGQKTLKVTKMYTHVDNMSVPLVQL